MENFMLGLVLEFILCGHHLLFEMSSNVCWRLKFHGIIIVSFAFGWYLRHVRSKKLEGDKIIFGYVLVCQLFVEIWLPFKKFAFKFGKCYSMSRQTRIAIAIAMMLENQMKPSVCTRIMFLQCKLPDAQFQDSQFQNLFV